MATSLEIRHRTREVELVKLKTNTMLVTRELSSEIGEHQIDASWLQNPLAAVCPVI